MEISFSLAEIDQAAQKVLQFEPQKVILFHGEMGAGKTTFIKALSKAIGVKEITGSPTFSLVNEYWTDGGEKVFHFDVYRIKSEAEALDIGIDEYLYSGDWCLIEWAEKIPNLIPEKHSVITITETGHGRRKLTLT